MAAVSLQSNVTSTSTSIQTLLKYGWMDFFVVPVQVTGLSQTNTWETVSIASIVGNSPNLSWALIGLEWGGASGGIPIIGVRSVGSSDVIPSTVASLRQNARNYFFVRIGSSAQIQVFRERSDMTAWVIGFGYNDSVEVFDNYIDVTPATRDANTTIDVSANVPATAVAAIFYVVTPYLPMGIRANGATDPNPITAGSDGVLYETTVVTSLGTGRVVEAYLNSDSRAKILLRGYLKEGFDVPFNPFGITSVFMTTGSYGTLTWTVPVGRPRAIFIQCNTVNAQSWQIRPTGSIVVDQKQTTAFDFFPARTGTNGALQGIGTANLRPWAKALAFANLPLSGTATSTSPVTGGLKMAYAMKSNVTSTSTVTGLLRRQFRLLAPPVTSTSTVTAALRRRYTLVSPVTSTATVTGVIRVTRGLRSNVTATSTVTGAIRMAFALRSNVTSISTVTGAIRMTYALRANVASTSPVTAVLGISGRISSSVVSTSTVTAGLRRLFQLASAVTSTSTVTAPLRRLFMLTSAVTATSTVTGSVVRLFHLVSTVNSASVVTGTLGRLEHLVVNVASTSTVTGTVRRALGMVSAVTSFSTASASIRLEARLRGIITSISSVIADLTNGLPGQVVNLQASAMGEAGQDFVIFRGNRKVLAFEVRDRDVEPIVLENAVGIMWHARRSEVAPAIVISKLFQSGITVDASTCNVTLRSADTAGLEGAYYHELIIESVNSTVVASTGRMYVQQSAW